VLLNSPRANAVLQTDLINTRHDRLRAPWLRLGWCTTAFLTCHPRVPPQNDLMLPRVFCEKKLERGVIVLQGVPSEPWSPQNLPRSREESGCLILPPITKATVILKMTPQQVSYGCPWMGSWVPFLFLVVGKMWYTNLYWRSGPGPTRAREVFSDAKRDTTWRNVHGHLHKKSHDFTSTRSIAGAASITYANLCYPSTSISMRYLMSTTKCGILLIITGWLSWYLAHVDRIEIQFNNEGLIMFLYANHPWFLIDSQTGFSCRLQQI